MLLLDEPAAGLDTRESRWLGDRIRTVSDTGVGVLLVDHDVALVLDICDYIYVLDFGRIIAAGTPAEIRASRAVADAYLGAVHTSADDQPSPDTPPGAERAPGRRAGGIAQLPDASVVTS